MIGNAIYELTSLTLREQPSDDDPDVVPLPAGLPLMLGVLGAFGRLRAYRRS